VFTWSRMGNTFPAMFAEGRCVEGFDKGAKPKSCGYRQKHQNLNYIVVCQFKIVYISQVVKFQGPIIAFKISF
jgi:hypothetical protein